MAAKKETRIHRNLFVHKYGDKGQVLSVEPYVLKCEGSQRYFEQPPGSGKYFNPDWSYNEERSQEAIMVEAEKRQARKISIEKELKEMAEAEAALVASIESSEAKVSKKSAKTTEQNKGI